MKKESDIAEEESRDTNQVDYHDLYQRSLAEQENLKKRLEQEKRQFAQFALSGAVESLLPVVDNFYRATEHVPAESQDSAWLTGIMHIQKQLTDVMAEWGVEEMNVKPGDAFNAEQHEAIGILEVQDVPEDSISQVTQKGYMLHGKVLRPAKVMTNTKPN